MVYSQDTLSFGIRPSPVELKPSKKEEQTLTDLPVEVLQLVFGYLDSWSLFNISLVNNMLRKVERYMLSFAS